MIDPSTSPTFIPVAGPLFATVLDRESGEIRQARIVAWEVGADGLYPYVFEGHDIAAYPLGAEDRIEHLHDGRPPVVAETVTEPPAVIPRSRRITRPDGTVAEGTDVSRFFSA